MRQNIYLIIIFLGKLQAQRHTGIYSGSISKFQEVVPRILNFEKDDLENETASEHHKNKREIVLPQDQHIQMELELDGKNQVLDLWRSNAFMADNLIIQKIGYGPRNSSKASVKDCHYRGTIKDERESSVALSTCNGKMVGLIRSKRGSYWLEPSTVEATSGQQPHLLFKRSAVESVRQRKKKKRKKADKVCGTRDHRHFVKTTRLQWNRKKGYKVKVQGRRRRRKKRLFTKEKKQNKEEHDKRHSKARMKRSVSRKRHVECLVVADSSVLEFYQGEDVETYLLTIMNMVNVMYHDASIGNYINIVVVRILLLEDESAQGLNVSVNADTSLDSFCRWQRNMNHLDDSHPLHHDVAILVTRQDICSSADEPCSTLGVAHVEGMCHPDLSCSVNEDNGATLAHTIAHELGHNFGMLHDTAKSGCSGRDGQTLHVMTTSFEADILHVAWSGCSRRDITRFFDGGLGNCLVDEPASHNLQPYPELPIGAIYNAEYQCKIQFSVDNTSVCTPLDEVCSRLWCIVDGVCTTMLHPAAPGTYCGKHKWCDQLQSCVGIDDHSNYVTSSSVWGGRVHGGWGPWQPWTPCSRSCGAGVSMQQRLCNHPVPANGGDYCLGERTRYRTCNTQECQPAGISFRAEQCLSFNNKVKNSGVNVSWLPFFDTTEPCQLFCTDEDGSVIMPMGVNVLDGTPCTLGRNDMCIDGICRKVGCDWVVDSDLVEDRCGNCFGDGSQCTIHENYYNRSHGTGYVKLVTIPKKARNIIVEELGHATNYIGVGSAMSSNFYLNGDKAITLPGEYAIADSRALYKREKELETLHILGPIKEDINIYIIFQDGHKNLGVHYKYTLPKKSQSAPKMNHYFWRQNDWTTCSVTCGQGEQRLAVVCQDPTNGMPVDDEMCDISKKPRPTVRLCSLQPCVHRWWTGEWQVCPVTCGETALRHRTVLCVTEYNNNNNNRTALADWACGDKPKPKRSEPCPALPPCLFATSTKSKKHLLIQNGRRLNFEDASGSGWHTMPWSRCSRNCGLGFKKRTVFCARPDNSNCQLRNRPIDVKQCFKKCF